jgi:hypothetical protein
LNLVFAGRKLRIEDFICDAHFWSRSFRSLLALFVLRNVVAAVTAVALAEVVAVASEAAADSAAA